MPAVTAHYYFGQEVLKLLPKEIESMIEENKEVFDFGLQGPDFLFFYKPIKNNRVSNLGHRIHREPASIFLENALKRMGKAPGGKMRVYLMGFVCHFILDSSLHGRISQAAPKTQEHNMLEAELDGKIIREHYDLEPQNFKRYDLLKVDTDNFRWMEAFYPELSETVLKKAAKSFRFYAMLLHPKPLWKRNSLSALENAFFGEYRFTSLIIGKNENEKFSGTVDELYLLMGGLAVKAAEAVGNVYALMEGKGTLSKVFERNFK